MSKYIDIMPVNYQKSKIYKLTAEDTPKVWIGATTKSLCQRMAQHRDTYKNYIKGQKQHCSSFDVISGKGARIELIEAFPCKDKDELNKRLYEVIRSTPNAVNGQEKTHLSGEETKHEEPESPEPVNEIVQ